MQDTALTDNVVEFMAGRLHKLPEETQKVLKLAACIGNQFDLETLAIICEIHSAEVAADLWSSLREGLVLPQSQTYKFFQGREKNEDKADSIAVRYRFLHDRVQQAAYSLIPDQEKQTTHYRIGQRLLQNTSPEMREERIFELVGQLNYGTALICEQTERDELAKLNLIACCRAKNATAYGAGREYARKGLSLLGANPWQKQYETVLALTELAAEFAALCGDWEAMESLVAEVVANSHSLVEQANVYRLQIQTHTSRNQMAQAIAVGLEFLKQLGVTFPETPTEADIAREIATIPKLIGDRQVEDLLYLHQIQDAEKIAIVQIAQSIFATTYISSPQLLFPLVVSLAVSFSIQYGNIPPSGQAYACYGLMLSATDVITGVQFGYLALQLADKLAAKTAKPEVLVMAGAFLLHRTSPMRETLPLLQAGYTSALEVGNPEFAGYNAHHLSSNSFWCGRVLEALAEEVGTYCRGLQQMNQLTTANYLRIYWQTTLNLLGRVNNPTCLSGEALQEKEALSQWQAANDVHALFVFHTYKLMLCYLFRELEVARTHIYASRQYLSGGLGTVNVPAFHFYTALDALGSLQLASGDTAEVFQAVETDLASLQQWADYAPMNHQHKVDLVAAEKCRVLEQKLEAIELYDKAISGAKENQYIQEEALANELAAKFYLDWGKEKYAALHIQEAYYCYARWGAKAKIQDLEKRYRQLLTPILQQPTIKLSAKSTYTNFNTKTTKITDGVGKLDLAALMKATRTLSRKIESDSIIVNLMQIISENAGAENAALILFKDGTLMLEAQSINGEIAQKDPMPVEETNQVPLEIVNTVKNTQTLLILDDARQETRYQGDPYIQNHQPCSLLCLPLQDRGKLRGILYLENNQSTGAFAEERVEVLSLLCAQAAITLENARLYQESRKALELERELHDLQQTQIQLIQSEKMFSLGQMVAGIAHEINNPVSFIHGNITHANQYMQEVLELLALCQNHCPQLHHDIQIAMEEMDLEFLRSDFEKVLKSMEAGSERIKNIVTSLRTFARLDESEFKRVDLHEGIESTLTILQNRLRKKEKRVEIQVVKDYGKLPLVECYAGQLNQVFLNILNNAIDALEECKAQNSLAIRISTETDGKQVTIAIADNGEGMNEETKKRLFDPFFTTKEVGKGTGLGLAIAHQIVTEKHGGKITCNSTVGKGTTFTIMIPR
ncbi:trifunctional serine/threonine-protein kinase/ATP-binding protein/sensor histidine kinase [Dapis sp. BLCC M126]